MATLIGYLLAFYLIFRLFLWLAGKLFQGSVRVVNKAEASVEKSFNKFKREYQPLNYSQGYSKNTFEYAVKKALYDIPRIYYYTINDAQVICKVDSLTGNSIWQFELDFNDWGRITGKCWIDSENWNSKLPMKVCYRIQDNLGVKKHEYDFKLLN